VRTAADYEVLSTGSPTSQTGSSSRDTDTRFGYENRPSTERSSTRGDCSNGFDNLSGRLVTEGSVSSLDPGIDLLGLEPPIGKLQFNEAHLLRHFQVVLGPLVRVFSGL
jgi:hypothetical protein